MLSPLAVVSNVYPVPTLSIEMHQEWPEWVDPRGSSRAIDYEDILKNVGKSDEEIARIRKEAEAQSSFDRIFET